MTADKAPWFILAGGINGAGKSTFLQGGPLAGLRAMLQLAGETVIEVINPDTETRRLLAATPQMALPRANLQAAIICESRVRTLILERQGHFAIETVLSSDKYKDIVQTALAGGWNVLFLYVVLDSAEDAVARVANRVRLGGHDVPAEKIKARWPRSLANVRWFWERSTAALVFFNPPNYGAPDLVAEKSAMMSLPLHEQLTQYAARSPGIRELAAVVDTTPG